MFENFYQGKKGCQAQFVVGTGDAFFQVLEGYLSPAVFHHRAGNGHLDSQETVSLPVLSGSGFEKTGKAGYLGRVGLCKHL